MSDASKGSGPGGPGQTYSEASQRTFERALLLLEKKLDPGSICKLRALLDAGVIHDDAQIVRALDGLSE